MTNKTITLSEDAYDALNTLRKGEESFTDVILRKFAKKKSCDLLNHVKAMEIDREILILRGMLSILSGLLGYWLNLGDGLILRTIASSKSTISASSRNVLNIFFN